MADMTRIVTAVIAITVRVHQSDIGFMGGDCYRAGLSACAYDCRVHRNIRRTCRVQRYSWCGHAYGNRWNSDGCC